MTLPLWIIVFHYIGDWLLQSNWMATNKSKNVRALLYHVSVYTLVMTTGALVFLAQPGPAFLFGLITFITHAVTDAITSRLTTRFWFVEPSFETIGYRINSDRRSKFFDTIGVDQMIHYITLALTIWWVSR